MKKILLTGLISGILAAIAGVIYFTIYQNTLGTAFGNIVNIPSIAGSSIFGTMMIALGYAILFKTGKMRFASWYSIFVSIASFATIVIPISLTLPLTVENPELFPGLVVPMHFFPALSYFTITSFYEYAAHKSKL